MKELGGKTGLLVELDLPLAGGGTKAGVRSPHRDNCLSQRRNIQGREKQLICGSLNGMKIKQSLPQLYIPQTGTQVPEKAQQLGAGVYG